MQSVSDQAVGVDLIKGVRPDQQLVKVGQALNTLYWNSTSAIWVLRDRFNILHGTN